MPIKQALRDAAEWGADWLSSQRRESARLRLKLGRRPRYVPGVTGLAGYTVRYPDAASLLSSHREIFGREIYAFDWPGGAPAILDLGANVGLSVLYFKRRFPGARITAFEADPGVFEYLAKNLSANRIEGVELVQAAAWNADGTLAFAADGADAGRLAPYGAAGSRGVEVPTVDMGRFLAGRRYDMIKIDIEGAEARVLPAMAPYLGSTRFLFVEYHSAAGHPQRLGEICTLLTGAGFRLHVQPVMPSPQPFLERREQYGYDMQLNLFAWRP